MWYRDIDTIWQEANPALGWLFAAFLLVIPGTRLVHMRIWHICTQENPPMSKFYPEKLFSCQLPSPITLCFVPPLSPPPNLYNTMFKSVLVSSLLVSAGLCQRSQSMWGQCKHPILPAVLRSPVGCLSNHNAPQKVAAVITPEQRHVPLPHTAGMTG